MPLRECPRQLVGAASGAGERATLVGAGVARRPAVLADDSSSPLVVLVVAAWQLSSRVDRFLRGRLRGKSEQSTVAVARRVFGRARTWLAERGA